MTTFTRHAAALAVIAATLGSTTQVLAQDATYQLPTSTTSLTTRADVQTELNAARAAGNLQTTEADFYKTPAFASTLTRTTVQQELRAAQASGNLPAAFAEPQEADLLRAQHKPVRPALIAAL